MTSSRWTRIRITYLIGRNPSPYSPHLSVPSGGSGMAGSGGQISCIRRTAITPDRSICTKIRSVSGFAGSSRSRIASNFCRQCTGPADGRMVFCPIWAADPLEELTFSREPRKLWSAGVHPHGCTPESSALCWRNGQRSSSLTITP